MSGSEYMMEMLARKAEIERKALGALRFRASTICVSSQYGVVL